MCRQQQGHCLAAVVPQETWGAYHLLRGPALTSCVNTTLQAAPCLHSAEPHKRRVTGASTAMDQSAGVYSLHPTASYKVGGAAALTPIVDPLGFCWAFQLQSRLSPCAGSTLVTPGCPGSSSGSSECCRRLLDLVTGHWLMFDLPAAICWRRLLLSNVSSRRVNQDLVDRAGRSSTRVPVGVWAAGSGVWRELLWWFSTTTLIGVLGEGGGQLCAAPCHRLHAGKACSVWWAGGGLQGTGTWSIMQLPAARHGFTCMYASCYMTHTP